MLPVYTNDQIANYLTTGFATSQGYTQTHWNVSTGGTITVNISALAAAGQFFATAALKTWSEITGINFTFTTGVAKISFFDDGTGSAYETDSSTNGFTTSAAIHISQDWIARDIGKLNSYSYQTYLHEIGHALGLGHAGNYNGSGTYDPNLGTAGHNVFLNDSWQISVMSYFSQTQNTYLNPVGGTSTASYAYVMTPMAADILAIQSYYGTTTTAHTGNTVYGFHATAGNAIFDATQVTGASYTIEDSSGIDTMDYSGYTMNQKISLVAETFSDIGGVKGSVTIARGTVVENAIGGSGSDIIIGNTADNILKGGAGTDTLDGGAGNDTADYSDKPTSVFVTLSGATLATVFINSIAEDSIKNIESVIGGSGNDTLTGDGLSNTLNGGLGDDTLIGGVGADTLIGGGGNDTVSYAGSAVGVTVDLNITTAQVSSGDASGDVLVDIKSLTGSAFNDILTGSTSNAFVNGGGGNDIIIGSAFYSILTGGSGNDTFIFTVDTINYAATHNLTANSNNIQDYTRDATGAGDQIALVGIAASTINYTSMGPTLGYLNYTNGAVNGSGNSSITLNYSISQLASPLLVYGYATLANAEAHNLAAGYIFTLDSYTPSQTWSRKLDSYNVSGVLASTDLYNRDSTHTNILFDDTSTHVWSSITSIFKVTFGSADQIISSSTVNDNGSTSATNYDYTASVTWQQQRSDFDSSNHLTASYFLYDNNSRIDIFYDTSPGGTGLNYQNVRNDYNPASQLTSTYYLFDTGTRTEIFYDTSPGGTGLNYQSVRNDYDVSNHLTFTSYLLDGTAGTSLISYNVTYGATTYASIRDDLDAQNHLTYASYVSLDGSLSQTYYDPNHLNPNYDSSRSDLDAAGHVTFVSTVYDDNTRTDVYFDVANLQPWSYQTYNYDAQGHLLGIITV
jgi:Ca2+-binding RTX toxin-like protein